MKQPDIKFVLPGGPGHSAGDLQSIAAAAAEMAAIEDLLPVAWEVASDGGAWPRGWLALSVVAPPCPGAAGTAA